MNGEHGRRGSNALRMLCAVALLVAVGTATAAAGPRVRLATLLPKGSTFHQALLRLGEAWREEGVKLTVYADGTMGGEADTVRRMRLGQLQAGVLTVTGLSEIDRGVTALQNLPLLFRSLDEVDHVREQLTPMLEERLREQGFVVLFWGDAGWVRFFSKTPVVRPGDLRRVKLFTWAGFPDQVQLMKEAGLHPVPLETSDILPGLQTGLVDAVPLPPFYALAAQVHRTAGHMLDLPWAPLVGAAVITAKAWESFEPAQRQRLQAAARVVGAEIREAARAEADAAVAAMVKRGLQVHPVPAEALAEWQALVESFHPRIRGEVVPEDVFDRVIRIVGEYRDRLPAEDGTQAASSATASEGS